MPDSMKSEAKYKQYAVFMHN